MLRPDTRSRRVDGSGTLEWIPGTLFPSVVPKENVALLTSDSVVTPRT